MQFDMSTPQSARPQAATRQLPVARAADREPNSERRISAPPPSSARLQAAVARKDSANDFYADVPCTD